MKRELEFCLSPFSYYATFFRHAGFGSEWLILHCFYNNEHGELIGRERAEKRRWGTETTDGIRRCGAGATT